MLNGYVDIQATLSFGYASKHLHFLFVSTKSKAGPDSKQNNNKILHPQFFNLFICQR